MNNEILINDDGKEWEREESVQGENVKHALANERFLLRKRWLCDSKLPEDWEKMS